MYNIKTGNCESGIIADVHSHSLRWHVEHEGKTLIVYADTLDMAQAIIGSHTGSIDAACKVVPSGYYCRNANAIYQAKDGPTTYVDARKSGM